MGINGVGCTRDAVYVSRLINGALNRPWIRGAARGRVCAWGEKGEEKLLSSSCARGSINFDLRKGTLQL